MAKINISDLRLEQLKYQELSDTELKSVLGGAQITVKPNGEVIIVQ
jgi:bacteriocin-like protein